MSQSKSIDDLFVDEEELNEALLAEVLEPYVQIGSSSGAFVATRKFDGLQAMEQATVVLLFQKARAERDLVGDEKMTPTEITEVSGINNNTVKGAVRELDGMNLVENESGAYSIPAYNLEAAKELVQADG